MKILAVVLLITGLGVTDCMAGVRVRTRGRSCGGRTVLVDRGSTLVDVRSGFGTRVRVGRGFFGRRNVDVEVLPATTTLIRGNTILVPDRRQTLLVRDFRDQIILRGGTTEIIDYGGLSVRDGVSVRERVPNDLAARSADLAEDFRELRSALAPLREETNALSRGE